MKKTMRAAVSNPESRSRRALRVTRETVRVLSATDLGRAAGGSGCITTTDPTATSTTRTEGTGNQI
jgi:hypothetical protein